AAVRAAGLGSPALVLVGEAVGLRRPQPERAGPARAREPLPGMILMSHGSPLAVWQRGMRKLASELARPGQFSRAAFLPPVRPGLGEAVAAAAAAGVRRLAVVPYFLAPGLHVSRDLPQLVAAARRRFPKLRIALAPCLDGHPALRTAVLARAAEAFGPES
ncbi:MAG: sirohydrochlorin chelatase, partial [Terriglobales bacterium]